MKILIADDHALVRCGLIDALVGLEPQCLGIEAADAAQVLAQVAATPDLDLVVLDLFMPGAEGFDLLRQVCAALPTVPVVILSASEAVADMQEAFTCGAAGFIPKSTSRELMIAALQVVLNGGRYVPPDLVPGRSAPAPTAADTVTDSALTDTQRTNLTNRQQDVLRLLGRGWSNKQIARELGLTENTVKVHVARLLRQLDAANRTDAVMRAQARGFTFDT